MMDNKEIVLEFYAAGGRGDMDTCLSLISDEIIWTNIGSTKFSGTFKGKQALLNDLLGPLFGQLKAGITSTIENVICEGNTVVIQTKGQAETHEGKAYNNTYCQVMTVENGKIIQVTEYFDTALVDAVLD
ncbi:nuclear transport factor 2 family protein [Glaciecola sp. 1036]|uniref:nuclear transport factor 2 family protein n=1 Tax=Alteromonadaceae TaxID=72275 RepID=UPI003D02A835